MKTNREGSLQAPTRHPLNWKDDNFWRADELNEELERVFDICHGCRRCVSLCDTFPTLFDLVDESETMEVDGVNKSDYDKVVDQCYLCDLCYQTKCPYVPPHEWNVDFPHLMLRAKAQKFKAGKVRLRDRILTSTDALAKAITTIPLVDLTVNTLNNNTLFRSALDTTMGIHKQAPLPSYHRNTLRRKFKADKKADIIKVKAVAATTGKVAFYATCYGNYHTPGLGEDFVKVFEHNGINIDLVNKEACCGMPKLELGDLDSVDALKQKNIPILASMVDEGYDLIAPIPSCVLMYKQELPLMYPEDPDVQKVKEAFYDPFEYLYLRHKAGEFNTHFKQSLGDISYQVACHLRVQKIGYKTRDILNLVPDTQVQTIERCSGHDGTYAVKKETRLKSLKIARPVVKQVNAAQNHHFASDCPMAAVHIENLTDSSAVTSHPMSLLRKAYGI
jgi:Fe-S oxidoreductase